MRYARADARRRAGAVDRPAVRGAALTRASTRQNPQGGVLDLLLARARGGARARRRRSSSRPPTSGSCARGRRCATRSTSLRVEPMDEPRTLALAAQPSRAPSRRVLREALALGRHFLGDAALPGALLSLLEATRRRREGDEPLDAGRRPRDDLRALGAAAHAARRARAARRRRAAGVLRRARDRPAGGGRVHGRARRAAQGGADGPDAPAGRAAVRRPDRHRQDRDRQGARRVPVRLGRPDDPARHERVPEPGLARGGCSATTTAGADASLVGRIRRQPFSVVLLDEFEKADPSVWDLFLQVFDDGRLSDPRGAAADFRHAVIIMTSNLGAKIPTGSGHRLLARDRVRRRQRRAGGHARVPARVPQPDRPRRRLPAAVAAGDARDPVRGARGRARAARAALAPVGGRVRRLGARVPAQRGLHAGPRRAAVEARRRAPLPDAARAGDRRARVPERRPVPVRARRRRRPHGHVRGPGRAGSSRPPAPPEATLQDARARGRRRAWSCSRRRSRTSRRASRTRTGRTRRRRCSRGSASPGFWDDEGRFAVLGGVELRDRIESGLRSAALAAAAPARRAPAAGRARAARGAAADPARRGARRAGRRRARRRAAAGRRRPGVRAAGRGDVPRLGARARDAAGGRRGARRPPLPLVAATVTGFAALRTLAPESGFHVLEIPDGRGGYDRRRVRVTVTPRGRTATPPAGRATIVRRYRERPTPLVRDAVRGWRTGRLDAVLAGGFDLVRVERRERRAAARASPARRRTPRSATWRRRARRLVSGASRTARRARQHGAAARELRALRREADAHGEPEREQVAEPETDHRQPGEDRRRCSPRATAARSRRR